MITETTTARRIILTTFFRASSTPVMRMLMTMLLMLTIQQLWTALSSLAYIGSRLHQWSRDNNVPPVSTCHVFIPTQWNEAINVARFSKGRQCSLIARSYWITACRLIQWMNQTIKQSMDEWWRYGMKVFARVSVFGRFIVRAIYWHRCIVNNEW